MLQSQVTQSLCKYTCLPLA